MPFLLLVAVLLVVAIAVRPIRALVILTRIVLFLAAAGFWGLSILMYNDEAVEFDWTYWLLPLAFTLLWALTFIRRRPRSRV